VGIDEEGTLAQLNGHRRQLIDRKIRRHRGHIIRTTGDGMLVEFAIAVDAVQCAVEIQCAMVERNADVPLEHRIEFRVGINVGDIIEDKGDIFGDGVNVAARLESIAARGGICISQQVVDQIEGKLKLQCRELGRQNLKNISRPVEVYSVNLDEAGSAAARVLTAANLKQDIRYCRAADGVRLAYAKVGTGPALLRSAHWLGHLEYDWELPAPFLA
jgi:class 3 adenylate cyclase